MGTPPKQAEPPLKQNPTGEQPVEASYQAPGNYRLSWPIVFVIMLIIMASLSVLAYLRITKLQGQVNSRSEQVNHASADVAQANALAKKAVDDLTNATAEFKANSAFVGIPEWGVRFKSGDDLKDLLYFNFSDSNQDSLFPTTRSIMKLAYSAQVTAGKNGVTDASTKFGDCGPGSIGILSRGKKDTPLYSSTYGQTQGAIQIGDYYYLVSGPQAPCSQDKAVQELSTKQVAAFKEAVKTLELLK